MSFNRKDYDILFQLGKELYRDYHHQMKVREIAVQLMAMSESVLGQREDWPYVMPRYKSLRKYPYDQMPEDILE